MHMHSIHRLGRPGVTILLLGRIVSLILPCMSLCVATCRTMLLELFLRYNGRLRSQENKKECVLVVV